MSSQPPLPPLKMSWPDDEPEDQNDPANPFLNPPQQQLKQQLAQTKALTATYAQRAEAAIYRQYARAVEVIFGYQDAGQLTKATAEQLRAKLRQDLNKFVEEVNATVADGTAKTVAGAAAGIRFRTVSLLSQAGIKKPDIDWKAVGPAADKIMARQRGAADFKSLLPYSLEKNVLPKLDSMIEGALARGTSQKALTDTLAREMAAKDGTVLKYLSPKARKAALAAGEITSAQAKAAKRLLYDARRIAGSEIANAMRATNTAAMQASGIIQAAKWQTSGRHGGLPSSPDACDTLASTDIGFGPGFYPPDKFPDAPHPLCGCYHGEVKFLDVKDWTHQQLKPKKPKVPKAPAPVAPLVTPPAPKAPVVATQGVALTEAQLLAKKVGAQAGSNPGGIYEGSDGVRRYVKFYAEPAQAWGEKLANLLYRELGLEVPESVVLKAADGKWIHAAPLLEVEGTVGQLGLTKEAADKILDGFVADVFTANWDAVGTGLDNVVRLKGGGIARIDQGGSFLMRAMGGKKPDNVLDAIQEWANFSNPSVNSYYAQVFKKAGFDTAEAMGPKLLKQLDDLAALGAKHNLDWDALIKSVTPGLGVQDRARIVQMTKQRYMQLMLKRNQLQQALAPKLTPAEQLAALKAKHGDVIPAGELFGQAPVTQQVMGLSEAVYSAPTQSVTLKELLPTTQSMKASSLQNALGGAKPEIVVALRPDGKMVVVQGHTTLAAEILEGKTTLPVKVVKLDSNGWAVKPATAVSSGYVTSSPSAAIAHGTAKIDNWGAPEIPATPLTAAEAAAAGHTFEQAVVDGVTKSANKFRPKTSYDAEEFGRKWKEPFTGVAKQRAIDFLAFLKQWQQGHHSELRKDLSRYLTDPQFRASVHAKRAAARTGGTTGGSGRALPEVLEALNSSAPGEVKELWRGWHSNMPAQQLVGQFAVGKEFNIGISSFSHSQPSFSGNVMFHLKGQFRAINVQAFGQVSSYHHEREWITGGRFRVTGIRAQGHQTVIELEQVATFSVHK